MKNAKKRQKYNRKMKMYNGFNADVYRSTMSWGVIFSLKPNKDNGSKYLIIYSGDES